MVRMALSTKTGSIRVVGQDPSLRNWGLAVGTYDLETKKLVIDTLDLTNPELVKSKQVRQNSFDLESAFQLYTGAVAAAQGAHAVFVEVPVGSQSARAMASYGICVGVLGALRANGIPFFEVTPTEVKLAAVGNKTATKQDMIKWAMAAHPEANWPTYQQKGSTMVSEAKAEHMADAIAAIYAGLSCNSFQQMLPFLAASSNKESHANSAQAN
jgi:Holliday junction resolvasome RuvABC endonuclease subunit